VEPFGTARGLSALFMGVVLLPLAGSVSAIFVGARLASHDHPGLAVSTLSASAMQIPLFVTPLLVFAAFWRGTPLTLAFTISELIAIALAVFIAAQLAGDGRSNWLQGAQLLGVYAVLAKMVAQSFLTLTMVQPSLSARASASSAPAL
jgi:Ca2+:H+ antiporter